MARFQRQSLRFYLQNLTESLRGTQLCPQTDDPRFFNVYLIDKCLSPCYLFACYSLFYNGWVLISCEILVDVILKKSKLLYLNWFICLFPLGMILQLRNCQKSVKEDWLVQVVSQFSLNQWYKSHKTTNHQNLRGLPFNNATL